MLAVVVATDRANVADDLRSILEQAAPHAEQPHMATILAIDTGEVTRGQRFHLDALFGESEMGRLLD